MMSVGTIRVIVADDYPLVRQGLVNILKSADGIEVVGEAYDVESCLQLCRIANPHVLLLDTSLDETNVITAIQLIRTQFEGLKIIAVADQSERNCASLRGTPGRCRVSATVDTQNGPDCVVRSIRAGARGAIRLSDTTVDLVAAVRAVAEGRFWVDGNATARMMTALFEPPAQPEHSIPNSSLTPREDLICRLIAEGLSNKEIARRLSCAHQTVKNHISSILRKTGLQDRLQVARAVLLNPGCIENEPSGDVAAEIHLA